MKCGQTPVLGAISARSIDNGESEATKHDDVQREQAGVRIMPHKPLLLPCTGSWASPGYKPQKIRVNRYKSLTRKKHRVPEGIYNGTIGHY